MLILKGFKYRIYPNNEQIVLISKTFGCCRFVWNHILSDKQEYYKENHKSITITPAYYKKEFAWLKEVVSLALANTQMNLQTAYNNFFNKKSKCGFPKYKSKKNNHQSYTTNNVNNSIRLSDNKHIRLPKLGDVRIKLHRQLPTNGVIKSVTISRTPTMKYYVSILVEYNNGVEQKPVNLENSIGIDFSMHSFYVDNQGNECGYPKYYRKSQKKLAREQRRLSHMIKTSNNYQKQKVKVSLCYEKITNSRHDYLNKLSKKLADNYDIVCIEDLSIKGISRGLKLAKTTLDNSWGYFVNKLQEKCKKVQKIDRFFPSSKICNYCGCVNENLTLKDRYWECPHCHKIIDRDLNAAKNVLVKGLIMIK